MSEPKTTSVAALSVGIDLGTTNSTAAAFDGKDLIVVRNGEGSLLTPSVVRFDKAGRVLVGTRARRFLYSDPANTRSEFKRLMGTAHDLEFPASGLRKRPEDLSAEILKALRQDVADQLGCLPVRAVVSVPAMFELHQTAAVSRAAQLAGFERIELIQEPVAAAIAAGWTDRATQGAWMVFDLGGGTLDVSLLETREGLLKTAKEPLERFATSNWTPRAEKVGEKGALLAGSVANVHPSASRRVSKALRDATAVSDGSNDGKSSK